ncbi:elongation factor G [candidate division LCP-89 bacterium B3_LCP]|uniref:Elongation factor G n=1 Tax=candidate division LCP-89 bacterium B3_LCP TaxID=2012998 RepID=A0A532UTT4_UNCL8|nr:MAG: elongation factor G [candidate division LCP-89 bacterium B3_LCP]
MSANAIHNVALIGHSASGKTSLAEAMLFAMGAVDRMGKIEEGNTSSDYQKEEIDRQISIAATPLYGNHNGHKINIIDTPGYTDFVTEIHGALRVADAAIVVVDALTGPEVGTELTWKTAEQLGVPRALFINRLDKEHVSFNKTLESLQETFGGSVVPLQFAVNEGPGLERIVDVVLGKSILYQGGKAKGKPEEVPVDLTDKLEELRSSLAESVAENDEELLDIYCENGELTPEQMQAGLLKGFVSGGLFPVFCGSSTLPAGVDRLLDMIVEMFPNASSYPELKGFHPDTNEEMTRSFDHKTPTAFIFKTVSEQHLGELSFFRVLSGEVKGGSDIYNATQKRNEKVGQLYTMNGKNRTNADKVEAGDIGAVVKLKDTHTGDTLCDSRDSIIIPAVKIPDPVYRVAVIPRAKGDEEKLSIGLSSLHEEDPSFFASFDPELKQTIVAGQGELHLNVVLSRLKDKFGVEVDTDTPCIPYRESVRKPAEGQGKHKKQSGGRGQYGDVWLRVESQERGGEDSLEFVNAIVGGVVPSKFIPAVEKGIRGAMVDGAIAGYPVVDMKVTLYDGTHHAVDSSEMAFKIAASVGFKKVFKNCDPIILEPIYDIEVTVPEDYMGDVMGDISGRRGKIQGMDAEGKFQIIRAKVPLAELHTYSIQLRSMTSGRGLFRMKLSHYDPVPREIQEKLITDYETRREEGTL